MFSQLNELWGPLAKANPLWQWAEYCVDSSQRWLLFLDAKRRAANNMLDHAKAGMPPVLAYDYELLLDAREFERPANYALLRIVPPEDVQIDADKPPVVVVDPRAGHGPGIGGFKQDSEVGMALREGFPTYFVSFFPEPCEGQTLESVELAEIRFLEHVHQLHPDVGRPVVYGNCQAGWAVAMLGADRPDVCGPIVLSGAPMSYWAGEAGSHPMRAQGSLAGGKWAVRLAADLGGGKVDGAWLVHNFEKLDPANTIFAKNYNLYRDIDEGTERFLEFERWWTGFYQLEEEELVWIAESLFIGNHLEQGKLELAPGHVIDMRRAQDPIVIFASSGDNITPPAQALHWVAEVYPTTELLKQHGQRVVYLLNPHAGHLGIFVSASVARREHRAIIEQLRRLDELDPGLYELKILGETGAEDPKQDQFEVAFEERRVEDFAISTDKQAFANAAAASERLDRLYRATVRPWLRPLVTPLVAQTLRWLHPDRSLRLLYSERLNPLMRWIDSAAERAREQRRPADDDNLFVKLEREWAKSVERGLDRYRESRDGAYERLFRQLFSRSTPAD